MKTLDVLFACFCFALAIGVATAPVHATSDTRLEWVTPAVTAPRVLQGFFDSRAAQVRVSYHVYLPAQYAREPQRRFPVVYWLHGSGGGVGGGRALDPAR